MIVTYARPRTSTGFIDRFLVTAEAYHIPVHLVFNKQDDLKDKEITKQAEIVEMYESVGYPVHLISAIENENFEEIQIALKDKLRPRNGERLLELAGIVESAPVSASTDKNKR